MSTTFHTHRIGAVLDYAVDWSSWLADGDAVDSIEWIADPGLTLDDEQIDGSVASVRITVDGQADPPVEAGAALRVVCWATTTGGLLEGQPLVFYIID